MKKLLFITYLLIVCQTFSQEKLSTLVSVDYIRTIVYSGSSENKFTYNYILRLFPEEKFSMYDIVENSDEKEVPQNINTIMWRPTGDNLELLFKNYETNEMYLKDIISLKFFGLKESIDLFDWTIQEETKVILGYTCQKAISSFRGRDYEAWFTTAIPLGGPWKFDGLPGLILSIHSIDGYITYEATQLVIENKYFDFTQFENPFKKEKDLLSWEEFKALYKKKAIEDSKYKPEGGADFTIITPRMGIERYIEEDDPDYTIDKKYKFD